MRCSRLVLLVWSLVASTMALSGQVTSVDDDFEGFLLVDWDPNFGEGGAFMYTPVAPDVAYNAIKSCHCLSINGSGNTVTEGMEAAALMTARAGLAHGVHYYMPKRIYAYHVSNQQTIDAIANVYRRSAADGVAINLQTHSWSAYLATVACEGGICSSINHVAYAPATLMSNFGRLADAYANWNGKMTVIYSSDDVLSNATYRATQDAITHNARIQSVDAHAGHSLHGVMDAVDSSQYMSRSTYYQTAPAVNASDIFADPESACRAAVRFQAGDGAVYEEFLLTPPPPGIPDIAGTMHAMFNCLGRTGANLSERGSLGLVSEIQEHELGIFGPRTPTDPNRPKAQQCRTAFARQLAVCNTTAALRASSSGHLQDELQRCLATKKETYQNCLKD